MAWIDQSEDMAGELDLRPSLQALHSAFLESFENDGLVPEHVLSLCRLRVAFIHDTPLVAAGNAERLPTEPCQEDADALSAEQLDALKAGVFDAFDDAERTALILAEKMPYAHHEISDEEVVAAGEAFGNGGVVTLFTAISFYDATCRLKAAWGVL